jgi:hypothetical protein
MIPGMVGSKVSIFSAASPQTSPHRSELTPANEAGIKDEHAVLPNHKSEVSTASEEILLQDCRGERVTVDCNGVVYTLRRWRLRQLIKNIAILIPLSVGSLALCYGLMFVFPRRF